MLPPTPPTVLHTGVLVGEHEQLVCRLHLELLPASPAGRSDVRAECGVKIFFDVVSAETRAAAARELAGQVCTLLHAKPVAVEQAVSVACRARCGCAFTVFMLFAQTCRCLFIVCFCFGHPAEAPLWRRCWRTHPGRRPSTRWTASSSW